MPTLLDEIETVRSRHCDVLVVDDHPDNREILVVTLSAAFEQLAIECASDGLEALMLVCLLRPRLLITDITMPRMDGWELIELVRGNPLLHHVKICVAAPLDRASSEDAIKRFRVEAFLELPLSLSEMKAEVARLLEL